MKKEFKLGPLQELWLSQLEKYPERKMVGSLGKKTNGRNYQACCLGELHLCYYRLQKKKLPFEGGDIWDGDHDTLLAYSFKKYGLRSDNGRILSLHGRYFKGHKNLANANDNGVTWPEIAAFIRKYPERVFTKSV